MGSTSARATYALQAIWFASTALAVGGIYMPLVDRVSRRKMLLWSSVLQIVAFLPFIFLKVTFPIALFNVLLFGVGAGIGQQSLFQLWSGEMFPTLLRSTAQGSCSVSCASPSADGRCCCRPSRRPASARWPPPGRDAPDLRRGGRPFAPRTRGRELDETGTDDIRSRHAESELQAA